MEQDKKSDSKKMFVSNSSIAQFETIETELEKRGRKDFSFAQFIDLLLEKVPASFATDLIESLTPEDFRLAELLKDKDFRAEIIRLGEQKNKKKRKDSTAESTV